MSDDGVTEGRRTSQRATGKKFSGACHIVVCSDGGWNRYTYNVRHSTPRYMVQGAHNVAVIGNDWIPTDGNFKYAGDAVIVRMLRVYGICVRWIFVAVSFYLSGSRSVVSAERM